MQNKEHRSVFEPLPIRQRLLTPVDSDQYSIRAQSGEIKTITALTAYEAVRLSGMNDVIKVERIFNLQEGVFEKSRFVDHFAIGTEGYSISGFSVKERAKMDKNPIFSPDELTELVTAGLEGKARKPASPLEVLGDISAFAGSSPELPSTDMPPLQQVFDDNGQSSDATDLKSGELAEAERALSADEVAKLLQ